VAFDPAGETVAWVVLLFGVWPLSLVPFVIARLIPATTPFRRTVANVFERMRCGLVGIAILVTAAWLFAAR
jgi:hypothetical protein